MPIPADFIRNWFGVIGGGHYEQCKEFGARWNRIDLCIWSVIELGAAAGLPERDEQNRMTQSHGVTPLLILDGNYTPPWATEEGESYFPPKFIEAGTRFISLEPWEVAPYGQWVPNTRFPSFT